MAGERPHSTATPLSSQDGASDDVRLSAPSAERNIAPIVKALKPYLPAQGYGLEIASGTGQHAIAFAAAFPGIVWQPTDIADERLDSIDAWRAQAGHRNMRLAQYLDATDPGWCASGFDVIVTVNLMHLVTDHDMTAVIAGVGRSLDNGGRWCLYGPFRSGGGFRSEGDLIFHNALRKDDPTIGYKEIETIGEIAAAHRLVRVDLSDMPANNLMGIFEKRP
ncbi:DUF938 domain-containing protein [Aliiroseovarius sp. KMU-50]|uniref:DUF938 domain-containing protein n=1 Tax=Aliiroseovarius salicola TaxID=3009082 RepID=A0ABT4W5D9_9RHOB|nr:DUF938 domain-containing protein [Aliiroseovarius sp. KMU-50]MDA5095215.1 DUF938 domain-containing protein [Aliiroseovarius sp. KMU-50]